MAFFNLSIHMDIPLMYLGLYLNVSTLTQRQPKLSFLCYSYSPLHVEILCLFAIFVKFLNGLYYLLKLYKNVCAVCVHQNYLLKCHLLSLSAAGQVYNYRATSNKV